MPSVGNTSYRLAVATVRLQIGYYLIKSLDNTRLVGSNDGWEQIGLTDFCGIHDYDITPANFDKRYGDIEETMRGSVNFKPVYLKGTSITFAILRICYEEGCGRRLGFVYRLRHEKKYDTIIFLAVKNFSC